MSNGLVPGAIPAFNSDGNLPLGIYLVTWSAVEQRFGRTEQRKKLLVGLREVLRQLKAAGGQMVYLDGSFVTRKHAPNDFDVCWDEKNVSEDKLHAVFFDFSQRRLAQKRMFGGEVFSANAPGGLAGETYLEFFQVCKRTKHPKGILAIHLDTVEAKEEQDLP